ncbi:MAG: hypothetical protein HUJ29_07735 [Gammaproteobacteria bacterium]|nr:hypothetical protein [Gammaproteobacteria bacterium]
MAETINLAVVGAAQPVGKAFLELLENSELELGQLHCLESGESETETVLYGNRNVPLQKASEFDFSQVEIALFADLDPTDVQLPVQAGQAGCIVVTTQAAFSYAADIPLVVSGVNDEALADYRNHNLVAVPDAGTCLAMQVLKPIHDTVGLTDISLNTMQSVSSRGEAGIRELASQTAKLLNGKPVEPEQFANQIAFNVVSVDGELLESGYSQGEAAQIHAMQKLLGGGVVEVDSSISTVPVFYGYTIDLVFGTARPIEIGQLLALWSSVAGLSVVEAGTATAVSDAAESEQIFINRPRASTIGQQHFRVSLVADNIRVGVAANLLGILQRLKQDYL